MAKLCPAGKAAAKKKFDVYPSAYANIWASKYCKGKVGRTKKANGGFIAKGCGKVMSNRRKKNKNGLMAKKGLKEWLDEKWVDIGAPKKNGKYQPCGRSKGSKRKYPKCVPLAKATRMTSGQKASAVRRKRAVSNKGPKPTNVKTFAKDGGMIGQAQRNYRGSYIDGSLGGVQVSNPSLKKYYKGML